MVQKPYNFELQNPKVLVILRWVHFEIQNTNLTFWKLCSYYIYAKILRTNSYPLYLDSACNLAISCTSWCKILSIIHTTQSAFWVSRLSVSIELYGCTTTSLMSSCETTIHLLSEIHREQESFWKVIILSIMTWIVKSISWKSAQCTIQQFVYKLREPEK